MEAVSRAGQYHGARTVACGHLAGEGLGEKVVGADVEVDRALKQHGRHLAERYIEKAACVADHEVQVGAGGEGGSDEGLGSARVEQVAS